MFRIATRFGVLTTFVAVVAACSPNARVAPVIDVPKDEAAVARGEYLANSVAVCVGCHSPRDWSAPGAPAVEGKAYAGGVPMNAENTGINEMAIPGIMQAPNLTQHAAIGLGAWTDGEILRAIREGVNKDGDALFAMMPYENLRQLSDRDAYAIVAYLRTLAPIEAERVERDLDFPLGIIVNFMPEPLDGPVAPAPASTAEDRGRYLATIAGCPDCHTPLDGMDRDHSRELAGGNMMWEGGTRAVIANLTPDEETGYGKATEEDFFRAMREGVGLNNKPLNPIMPWAFYRGMTDEDLRDIFAYMRSLPPVKNDMAEAYALLNADD